MRRMAPKLVGSISRAVNLCESTLAFGRAEEPPPTLGWVNLADLAQDVIDGERLAAGESAVEIEAEIPAGLEVRADAEQLHRVLTNLVRNARQAIVAARRPGRIAIAAREDDEAWWLDVSDTGPGLPRRAREHLFQPFEGGATRGGAGLGLAISSELVRGHGGRLDLRRSDDTGTEFSICLPKSNVAFDAAAE